MRRTRCLPLCHMAVTVFIASGLMTTLAQAQIPRLANGKPDFQGYWTNETETPVERPEQFSGRESMSAEEAAQWRPGSAAGLTDLTDAESGFLDPDRGPPPKGAPIALEADWYFSTGYVARVDGEYRTSLVIDPPDGRIPYAENGRGRDFVSQALARTGLDAYAGPEVRPTGERCLMSVLSTAGPPMLPMSYNSNYQIVQTGDYVMIMAEMVNDVRIVRMGAEHMDAALYRWMGDSIGYWEGDTLVVETRNVHPQQSFRGSSAELTTTETFRYDNEGQIIYRVTMNDPQVYGQPWTAEVPMRRMEAGSQIHEYACHEGNYSLAGALAGARRQEQGETQ